MCNYTPDIYDIINCMLSDSICIFSHAQTIPEDETVVVSSQGDHSSYQLAELRYVSAPMSSQW